MVKLIALIVCVCSTSCFLSSSSLFYLIKFPDSLRSPCYFKCTWHCTESFAVDCFMTNKLLDATDMNKRSVIWQISLISIVLHLFDAFFFFSHSIMTELNSFFVRCCCESWITWPLPFTECVLSICLCICSLFIMRCVFAAWKLIIINSVAGRLVVLAQNLFGLCLEADSSTRVHRTALRIYPNLFRCWVIKLNITVILLLPLLQCIHPSSYKEKF